MSWARARSTSENAGSGSVCGGISHPAAIQASSERCSRRARSKNSCAEIISNLQIPTRVMTLSRLPASGEFLNLRIERLGQHDLQSDVFIAAAAILARDAFAFEPQHAPGIRPFRDGHAYGPCGRGHIELRAKHRFRQTDRQINVDVVILASEE